MTRDADRRQLRAPCDSRRRDVFRRATLLRSSDRRQSSACPRSSGSSSIEAIDERRPVLVQERDEADRRAPAAWPSGKASAARARELAPQRFVAPLGRLNHLAVQRLQVVLHPAERRLAPRLRASDRSPASPATSRAIASSIARAASANDASTAGGNLRLRAAALSAASSCALQRFERQLVLARETAAPPSRASVADARGYISGIGTPKCS